MCINECVVFFHVFLQVFNYITLVVKYMPKINQIALYLCSLETVIITMVFIQVLFAKFLRVVHSKSSTTKNLHSFCLRVSTTVLRPCMNSQKCAQLGKL
jgi:hypothetical protein